MKFKSLVFVLALTGACLAHAEQPNSASELIPVDTVAANSIFAGDSPTTGAEAEPDGNCACRCSPQGILLRECDGETENLGSYGNLQNCDLHKKSHPRCQ